MKRPTQPSLFFDEVAPVPVAPVVSLAELYRLQIIRDSKVLAGDPIFHAPSREFYEERIASFREALSALSPPSL